MARRFERLQAYSSQSQALAPGFRRQQLAGNSASGASRRFATGASNLFKKALIPKAPSTIDNLLASYNGEKKERVESELLTG